MNEKNFLENRLHGANLKLEELGVLDTVNAFLATKETKAEVDAMFDNYLNGLKAFAAKMPNVAKGVTSKILEDVEKGKSDFVEVTFLYFKMHMGDVMDVKAVDFASGHKMLCLETIKKDAQELCEAASMTAKADIAENAFATFKTKEHVDAFIEALLTEPNGDVLMCVVKDRLRIIVARSLMMMMNPFFGQS